MGIKVERSDSWGDVRIVTSANPAERNITALTWDQLETVVREGAALLRARSVDWSCGLTDAERAALRAGEDVGYLEDEID